MVEWIIYGVLGALVVWLGYKVYRHGGDVAELEALVKDQDRQIEEKEAARKLERLRAQRARDELRLAQLQAREGLVERVDAAVDEEDGDALIAEFNRAWRRTGSDHN
jgi:hypothetical protein